jgi:hypothetical protein
MEFLVVAAAIVSLAVPGRASANASIGADGQMVAVVWAASLSSGATDIYTAVSGDGGRTFGAPVKVNDGVGDARASGEMPPRVAVTAPYEIAVAWTSKRDDTTIRVARSLDGGRSFGPSVAASSHAPGNRGWHAMTIDPMGRVVVVWLDHREMASEPPHQMDAATHGTHDGAAMAQKSWLYVSRIAGDVPTEQRVTAGVCYCCKTAIAAAADGSIVTAWRHVYPGSIRDIAFSRAPDGRTFSAPVRVSTDQWQLDGCPDDGPAIGVAPRGGTHIVWPTLVAAREKGAEPTIAVFYTSTHDGQTFSPRERVPTFGAAHHPQIAVAADGSIFVAWDEASSGPRHVGLARGAPDSAGAMRFTRQHDGEAGFYPAVAASGDGIVLVWTSGGPGATTIRVEQRSSPAAASPAADESGRRPPT